MVLKLITHHKYLQYIQIKTIIATFIQLYDWEFPADCKFPGTDFTTLIVMPEKPVNLAYKEQNWKAETLASADAPIAMASNEE